MVLVSGVTFSTCAYSGDLCIIFRPANAVAPTATTAPNTRPVTNDLFTSSSLLIAEQTRSTATMVMQRARLWCDADHCAQRGRTGCLHLATVCGLRRSARVYVPASASI